MNFLVIGCGSIGQRHIKNLITMNYKVYGCEKDPLKARYVREKYGIEVFSDLNKALKRIYEGAFICTPTNLHIPIAIKVAKKGINLFIEKPLSNSIKEIDKLSAIVNEKKLITFIGCNIRFFPSFKLVEELIKKNKIGKVLSVKVECGFFLPYWHPYEDYRKGYSANRCLGGGVIFDDVHEIDALYWLFGEVKEIFCFADKISNLDIDVEDIAEIFLKFKSGIIAQIHLDYLQHTYRRYYELIGEKGMIIWDYISQNVQLYSKKINQLQVFQENINISREIMFIDEIKHFTNCIESKENSINNITTAKKVLEIALACYRSIQRKEIIYL
ncbi:MAG: Gfo/Idh/MocA family oxidoreductase [Actinobacteria bacterium]|nr:Gfo/Idh/MocA family oxidoreductase [Actinomycetota bacterium]